MNFTYAVEGTAQAESLILREPHIGLYQSDPVRFAGLLARLYGTLWNRWGSWGGDEGLGGEQPLPRKSI